VAKAIARRYVGHILSVLEGGPLLRCGPVDGQPIDLQDIARSSFVCTMYLCKIFGVVSAKVHRLRQALAACAWPHRIDIHIVCSDAGIGRPSVHPYCLLM
jgi:hypothetical protein